MLIHLSLSSTDWERVLLYLVHNTVKQLQVLPSRTGKLGLWTHLKFLHNFHNEVTWLSCDNYCISLTWKHLMNFSLAVLKSPDFKAIIPQADHTALASSWHLVDTSIASENRSSWINLSLTRLARSGLVSSWREGILEHCDVTRRCRSSTRLR